MGPLYHVGQTYTLFVEQEHISLKSNFNLYFFFLFFAGAVPLASIFIMLVLFVCIIYMKRKRGLHIESKA